MDWQHDHIPFYDVRAMISTGDDPQLVEIHLDDIAAEYLEDGKSADNSTSGPLHGAKEGKSRAAGQIK
jgi:hypothetical protein